MKKLENKDVAYVANRLRKLQSLVNSPLRTVKNINDRDNTLINVNGEEKDEVIKAIIALIERYRPAAAAYLMRHFVRAGRIDDGIRAGQLSQAHAWLYSTNQIVLNSYNHPPTVEAFYRFLAPKIEPIIATENERRRRELADYITKISGEIIPPDPAQEAEQATAAEPVIQIDEKTEEIPAVELPENLEPT